MVQLTKIILKQTARHRRHLGWGANVTKIRVLVNVWHFGTLEPIQRRYNEADFHSENVF